MATSSRTAEAAADTRSTRLAQTTGYFAAFIAMGMYAAALGPTLPGLADQTGSALNQVSILFSARAFGYLIGSVAIGRFEYCSHFTFHISHSTFHIPHSTFHQELP